MNRSSVPFVIVAAVLLSGCSLVGAGTPSGAEPSSSADERDRDAPTVATVGNESWFNIRVYVADGGRRQQLGSVSSYDSATFEIPRDMVHTSGQVQLLADPVGSTRTYRSSPVTIGPGQVVQWTVQNDPSQTYSSIFVR